MENIYGVSNWFEQLSFISHKQKCTVSDAQLCQQAIFRIVLQQIPVADFRQIAHLSAREVKSQDALLVIRGTRERSRPLAMFPCTVQLIKFLSGVKAIL